MPYFGCRGEAFAYTRLGSRPHGERAIQSQYTAVLVVPKNLLQIPSQAWLARQRPDAQSRGEAYVGSSALPGAGLLVTIW